MAWYPKLLCHLSIKTASSKHSSTRSLMAGPTWLGAWHLPARRARGAGRMSKQSTSQWRRRSNNTRPTISAHLGMLPTAGVINQVGPGEKADANFFQRLSRVEALWFFGFPPHMKLQKSRNNLILATPKPGLQG